MPVFHPVRLPMYDWPEVREATCALEEALQAAIGDALNIAPEHFTPWPAGLDVHESWGEPGVLLTQTCGYPLTHALHGKVRLLGAPHYAAPGCRDHYYCSQIIVGKNSSHETLEDLRGARAVYNTPDSQSGMNAFRRSIAPLSDGRSFFLSVFESGGHLKSVKAVAAGDADVASIDAVCWWLVCQELPELANMVRPLAQTLPAPGLPMITSKRFSVTQAEQIADVVADVFLDPKTQKSRERLGIRGFSKLGFEDYASILAMEQEASLLGYPVLA
ncbi:PhnD/SsuA/transferrin family substrate-binding protein [uncultured Roseibium sp.]|uniref:phosphate/phosphite/phosphonate ABC transporter substrate-binding protein n=1 Tax=uncultured Roseibium sp. TaxID=1936171 RepID=UPI0026315F72|nr:PhnD/SsuA/transferrin family substrate-binding protein [uncultured Roseibium sp.]